MYREIVRFIYLVRLAIIRAARKQANTKMKRKIVKQGTATMTISLPSSWIKKFGLKEGDELDINENGNKVEVLTGKETSEDKIEIDATKGTFTKKDLSHLYILGFDEIIIIYDNHKVIDEIKARIPDCIGYEIIDQTEKKVVIKSISVALEEEFDTILRKVFLLLKEMSEGIYDAVSKKEYNRLEQLKDLELLNNKFTSFLLRLLMKRGFKNAKRTPQAYDLVQNLERLADEYKYLCDNLVKGGKIEKEELELLKQVNNFYALLYDFSFKYDAEKTEKWYTLQKELWKKTNENLIEKKSIIIHHLVALVDKIFNTGGSYLATRN